MADEQITVKLESDSRGFVRSFNDASAAIGNLTKAASAMAGAYKSAASQVEQEINRIATTAKKIAATIGGVAVATGIQAALGIKNFSSLQAAMANVATVTDTTKVSMDRMQEAVMKMSATIPKSAEEIASGLYEVNSAGFQGAQALEVLSAVSKFAVAGLVDTGTSVRATTGLLNAYNLSAEDATHVTDILFKAVEEGQMTAAEFAINIGDWASSAASLGVSFESASAALAVMTTRGAMPANLAATSLNSMLRNLIRPTDEMTKGLKRMGFESGKAALQSLGFAGTLGELWKQAGQNETRFASMFQDVEGFRGALGLVTKGYETLIDTEKRFNDRSQTAGTTDRAFEKQIDTISAKWQIFHNELRTFSYEIGKLLEPLVTGFLNFGIAVLRAFNNLPQPIKSLIAALRLLAPAITAVTVWLAAWYVKKLLMMAVIGRASKVIAQFALLVGNTFGLRAGEAVGRFGMAFEKIQNAGGFLAFGRQKLLEFAKANGTARLAMLRTAGGATVLTMAMGALAIGLPIAITKVISLLDEAKQKAQQFFDGFKTELSESTDPLGALQFQLRQTQKILSDTADVQKGGFWNGLKRGVVGTLQVVTPWTENNIVEDKARAKEAASYQAYLRTREYVINKMINQEWDAVAQLKAARDEGRLSEDAYYAQSLEITSKYLQESGVNFERLIAYQQEMNLIQEEYNSQGRGGEAVKDERFLYLQGEIDKAKVALDEYAERTDKVNQISEESGVAAARLADAIFKIGDEASTATDKLEAFKTIVDEVFSGDINSRNALASFYENLEKLGAAMRDLGPNFDLMTEDGRTLQDAMSGTADALKNLLVNIVETNGPDAMQKAADAATQYITALVGMARNAGYTEDQIRTLLTVMGLTPENLTTFVSLPGIDQAQANLLMTTALMDALNGRVSTAQVRIQFVVDMFRFSADQAANVANAVDQSVAAVKQKANQDLVKGLMANLPKSSGGGKGGGGGGGAAKWKPSAAQLANMRNALSQPLMNMLQGDLGDQWQKQALGAWYDAVTRNMFMEGKTRLGAALLRDAQKAGQDPTQEFEDMVTEYNRLAKLVGKINADIAINQFESLDDFKTYVDAMDELIQHQRDIEDWKYDNQKIGFDEYKKILTDRLTLYEEYSDEWMSLQDQIKQVDQDKQREEDRLMAAKRETDAISLNDYIIYLKKRLVGLEQYSEDWMDIWRDIQNAEDELTQQQEDRKQGIQDFADAVKDAFDELARSVEDPITRATSILEAFGDQATITQDQVTGFYSHMLEGTQRWVTVIRELKAKGVNGSFLNDLIKAGPQSLTFAEGILGLGSEGINMINTSMAEISSLSSGLGQEIARGNIGTLTQNDNSITISVGDVIVQGTLGDGVTLDEVKDAIQDAITNVTINIQNRQAVS